MWKRRAYPRTWHLVLLVLLADLAPVALGVAAEELERGLFRVPERFKGSRRRHQLSEGEALDHPLKPHGARSRGARSAWRSPPASVKTASGPGPALRNPPGRGKAE